MELRFLVMQTKCAAHPFPMDIFIFGAGTLSKMWKPMERQNFQLLLYI